MNASEAQIFLTQISTPLSESAPSGVDLRDRAEGSVIYSELRDARASARIHERARDDDPGHPGGVPEEWRTIETLSRKALSEQTRDLEVACWLTEALTRIHGLAGLSAGCRIIEALVEHFWENGLYPKLENDDPEARSFPVTGLSGADRDGSLIQPLRQIILFEMNDARPIAVWEYQRAADRAALAAQGGQVAKRNDTLPSLEEIQNVARTSGIPMLTSLAHEAETALKSWVAVQHVFEAACRNSTIPAETPSTTRVFATLEAICKITRSYVPLVIQAPEPETGHDMDDTSQSVEDVAEEDIFPKENASMRGPDRNEMLDAMLKIALRFRESEPHSPLSYTVENAVRRARLTLPDLLREIVEDDGARQDILVKLGIQLPAE